MRAWSYVRVSTDEQITGDGLNRQNRLYLDACALYGWEPGSVKEVDHDFVEAVEQVRKEIPGFTF